MRGKSSPDIQSPRLSARLRYVESDKRGYGKRLEIADACVAIMRLLVNCVCVRAADLHRELTLVESKCVISTWSHSPWGIFLFLWKLVVFFSTHTKYSFQT